MTERTTRTTVAFRHPAIISGVDGQIPAGSYVIETDDEMIPGVSFLAYRRIRTSIVVPVVFGAARGMQVVEIDPDALAAALARDADSIAIAPT